jgi:hypothetical protein
MKLQYKRPNIFVVDGFMEGVYAASGNASVSYKLTETDRWGNFKAYNLQCKNMTNETLHTLTINPVVSGNVLSIIRGDSSITSASVHGCAASITIHIDDPNGLAPGASSDFFYLSISGEGDNFSIS